MFLKREFVISFTRTPFIGYADVVNVPAISVSSFIFESDINSLALIGSKFNIDLVPRMGSFNFMKKSKVTCGGTRGGNPYLMIIICIYFITHKSKPSMVATRL